MTTCDRRTFLRAAAGAGLSLPAGYLLSACSSGKSGSSSGTIKWWEGGQPTVVFDKKIAAIVKVPVDVTYIDNTKYGQSLQLAHQSMQMPDVTNLEGLTIPMAALVASGWWQPLQLDDAATARLKSFKLLDGVHIFDGKVYSFPMASPDHSAVNWFHKDLLAKAGLDPANPPTTYDDFRSACRKVKASSGNATGVILALQEPGRNGTQTEYLAQCGGLEGVNGQLFRTGEFVYHTDPYLNAIEFCKSLAKDGLTLPGENTLNVKTGQARWATGATAFWWDGPWIPGNIKLSYPQLADSVGSGPPLVPDSSHPVNIYAMPAAGYDFVPAGAKHTDQANKIMSELTSDRAQVLWAEIMGHPPRDPSVLAKANVTKAYRDMTARMSKNVFVAPNPIVGNADIAKVDVELKPVSPDFGTTIQGYFSGDVTDLRGALKKLSDSSTKALEDAIKAAQQKGAKVSMADYAFSNWKARTDFTADMYSS